MSTTVKYNNNIIASLDGETKILATRGKWVEDDIEIIDVSVDGIGEGNIYQDEDGYIIIDENDNEPVTVKPATLLNHGEWVAPKGVAYSPVVIDTPERGEDYVDRTITEIIAGDLEGITTIRDYAFRYCTSLKSIDFGNTVNTIGSYAFQYSGLEHVVIPESVTNLGTSLFHNCTALKAVDFGKRTQFYQQNIFQNDTVLTTIVLRGDTLTSLTYTNVFDGTPFANGGTGGTIYIPKVLYDELGTGSTLDYKAATNWSTFDGYGTITWAQIEGSKYEHYYVDGRGVLQTVTTNLTNCSISNDIAHYHTEFETKIIANDGYSINSVTVTMNNVDITNTVYNSTTHIINISSPDGEIVITATAA